MKIFNFFITLVVSELCCFDQWTEWQRSSQTCGQVCRNRERDILHGFDKLWERNCNSDHYSCPTHESQSSCVFIGCRKFDNEIPIHCSKLNAFLSNIESLDRLVILSSLLCNWNAVKKKIMLIRVSKLHSRTSRSRMLGCISKQILRRPTV